MPLYEYACRQCTHHFESLVFGDEAVECPECQGRELDRQFSLPARPQTETALPAGCDPSLPPCGPACRRFPGG